MTSKFQKIKEFFRMGASAMLHLPLIGKLLLAHKIKSSRVILQTRLHFHLLISVASYRASSIYCVQKVFCMNFHSQKLSQWLVEFSYRTVWFKFFQLLNPVFWYEIFCLERCWSNDVHGKQKLTYYFQE